MKVLICENCQRIHYVDEKTYSYGCVCPFPRVLDPREYVELARLLNRYHYFVRDFVIENELWEFAFECADEEYKPEYTENIKKAIAHIAHYYDKNLTKLLENDDELFIKFAKEHKRFARQDREKTLRGEY